jgi:phytoene synthase
VIGELRDSYRFCAAVARREARNFFYSFLLLPAERRRSMCALYAFMRHTDDLADEPAPAADKQAALDAWRRELDRALAGGGHGAGAWQGLAALADTVRRHAIPAQYLHEVIDGVLTDARPQSFPAFEDLYRYCYRVASAVGLCCLHIWGYESAGGKAEELAEAYGIALQLTNILRDVQEDALNGRVYLPHEDLERFGVAPEQLAAPRPSDRLRALCRFEGQRTYEYYDRGQPLAVLVEPVGRPMLRAIVGIYRSLLDEIARRDYDVWTERVALRPWRKVGIALRSLAETADPRAASCTQPDRARRELGPPDSAGCAEAPRS